MDLKKIDELDKTKIIVILLFIGYVTEYIHSSYYDTNDVEIIEHHDCRSYGNHSVCGVVENKSSVKKWVVITVNYYDEDGVLITNITDSVNIEPKGKSKFQTRGYLWDEPFDYYTVFIDYEYNK